MGTRLELHSKLLEFSQNVYFQPPSNIQMKYPCIVYVKLDKDRSYSNNDIYKQTQGYQLTVIDKNPDSPMADILESSFQYCEITSYLMFDNLNQTILKLYY